MRLAATGALLHRQARPLRKLPECAIDWRSEILPQQSRLTVSWLLGYAIFASAAPITFRVAGSVAAGRLGVALQIYQAVNGAAGVWITRAQPQMGRLAGAGARASLRRLTLAAGVRSALSALADRKSVV